jgi:L-amino acid N-acyltransferase YncA
VIRPGRPGDADQIAALFDAYRAELAAAGHAEARDLPTWRRWLTRRISAGDVRVVIEEADLVGYIAWTLRNGPTGRVLSVTDLYVLPSERGVRHGAGLLARALDRARSDGAVEVEVTAGLDDEAAHGLVGSFGFSAVDGRLVLGVGS